MSGTSERCIRLRFPAVTCLSAALCLPCGAQAVPSDRGPVSGWLLSPTLILPVTTRTGLSLYGNYFAGVGVGTAGVSLPTGLGRHFTVAPAFEYVRVPSASGSLLQVSLPSGTVPNYREQQYRLETTATTTIGRVRLEDRNCGEYLIRTDGKAPRYRQRGRIDVDVSKRAKLRVFAYDEAFYDSKPDRWALNIVTAGFGRAIGEHLNTELFYFKLSGYQIRDVDVIGTSITFSLSSNARQDDRPERGKP